MVVHVQEEGVLIEMCLVAAKQKRSDVVSIWGQAKAFALPVGCIDDVPPSQENLGENDLALQLAREAVEAGLWSPALVGPGLLCLGIPGQLRLPDDCRHHGVRAKEAVQSVRTYT